MSTEIRKALQLERRQRHLQNLIEEAVINVLAEQAPVPPPPPPAAPPPPPTDMAPPPPAEEEPPQQQDQEFNVDDMIERLNVIRGGRSFTDPEVYGQLVTYFKALTDEQKVNLQQFLIAIGKIVINVQDQDQPQGSKPPPATPPAPPPPAAPPAAPGGPAGAAAPPAPPA